MCFSKKYPGFLVLFGLSCLHLKLQKICVAFYNIFSIVIYRGYLVESVVLCSDVFFHIVTASHFYSYADKSPETG